MVRDEPAASKDFGWSAALLDDPEEVGFGSSDDVSWKVPEYSVHHGEVLHVIVGLEQSVALQSNRDKGRG